MLAKLRLQYDTYLMNQVVPISEIESFNQIATDMSELLVNGENQDIADGFPATVERYTAEHDEVVTNLEMAQSRFEIGKHEQFIVFAGERAVGLSVITSNLDIPEGIDPTWPNISGFICNPFRGRGLGRLSIETRMDVVRRDFESHAWTFVKDDNVISEHLVLGVGFHKTDRKIEGWDSHHLFLFDEGAST